jgi:hypothetical protein
VSKEGTCTYVGECWGGFGSPFIGGDSFSIAQIRSACGPQWVTCPNQLQVEMTLRCVLGICWPAEKKIVSCQ